jgi:hypothetical protein
VDRPGSDFSLWRRSDTDPDPIPIFTHIGRSENLMNFIRSRANLFFLAPASYNFKYFGQYIEIFWKKIVELYILWD